jgi:ribonuclease P/MRP protein subunit RPP20
MIAFRHKTLRLSAMGAAIPHLMQLALSLPSILPYPPDEVHTKVTTGTVEVQDEVLPEDDDEDITYRTRGKSTLMVVIKIRDGMDEGPSKVVKKQGKNKVGRRRRVGRGGGSVTEKSQEKQDATSVVLQEPEQEDAA